MWFNKTSVIFFLMQFFSPFIEATLSHNLTTANGPFIHDTILKVLHLCFVDRLSTIIVTPDHSDIFYRETWTGPRLPVIVLDDNYQPQNSNYNHAHGARLATYVLTANSGTMLQTYLQRFKSSPWWNIESLFFIVDGSDQQICGNVSDFLHAAWKMNLLSVWYLCQQVNTGITLYTFNPFTNYAPQPWLKIGSDDNSEDRWTLYKQLFQEGNELCQSLDFDKTKLMNGYPIQAVTHSLPISKDTTLSSPLNQMGCLTSMTYRIIFPARNITTYVHFDKFGYWYNGKPAGFAIGLINGTYDIGLSGHLLHINMTPTHVFYQSEAGLLSQHRPFLTPLEKITNFYSTGVICLTILALIITTIIMAIYTQRGISSGAFEALRVLLSTGTMNPLMASAIRIYFFGVFWLIIIINATFQGNLASFLTTPERHDIETVKDLATHEYDLYVPVFLKSSLPDDIPDKINVHFVAVDDYEKYILNNPKGAYVRSMERLLHPALAHGLHISKKPVGHAYATHWSREDWPLLKTFNVYFGRVADSGLVDYSCNKPLEVARDKLKNIEDEDTAPVIRPIKMKDLEFAFQFYGVAITIAIIVFIAELLLRK